MAAQDAHRKGMKGGDERKGLDGWEKPLDAASHFLGCLVGEGDSQNILRSTDPLGDQVDDLVGDRPGLAAPRSREDQQRDPPCA